MLYPAGLKLRPTACMYVRPITGRCMIKCKLKAIGSGPYILKGIGEERKEKEAEFFVRVDVIWRMPRGD